MGTLAQELQELHDERVGVKIAWLWNGGVEVEILSSSGESIDGTSLDSVADILPWLTKAVAKDYPQKNYTLSPGIGGDMLEDELQKIYDSEINVELSWLPLSAISAKLGNESYGFNEQGVVSVMSEVLPWLQTAIHKHFPESRYDAERRGEVWVPKFVEFPV
jgi:hypothetical protein